MGGIALGIIPGMAGGIAVTGGPKPLCRGNPGMGGIGGIAMEAGGAPPKAAVVAAEGIIGGGI